MSGKPVISVVVPTKNRYKYLKQFVNLVEGFRDNRIELIIQDNSDDNSEIKEFLADKSLISTKYYYTRDKLSMGGNAERAILNSTGEYVCFMGDDDAVCRNIADCAEWMKKNEIEAVSPLYIEYYWNEAKGANAGVLYHSTIDYQYHFCNPINVLKVVLNNAIPSFYNLVRLYQAIVRRDILDSIKSKGGTLFPGPTPDISSAVALSFVVKKFVRINVPVTLPGMSRMGAGGVMGRVLTLDEVDFITDKDRQDWIKGFPPIWANEIIWPDGAMNALKYMEREDFCKYFNKNKMLSRLVAVHHNYFSVAYNYADNKLAFLFTFICYFAKEGSRFCWHKILSRINGKINGVYDTKKGFSSIAEAENYLMETIQDFSFDNLKIE